MTPEIPARFVQLTHTSVDRNDGRGGGWQVMDVRGAPTDAEQAELESRVPTQVSWPVPIPEFVDPQEQAALPSRLVYARTPDGGAAYWHSVPAGLDGTGRPGNVFTHVVLDRRPWERGRLRPAEFATSRRWLRPFGAAQVRAVDLAAVPEPPWSAADADAQWRDLLAAGSDTLLAVILDAVRGALQGGPRVVLAVADDRVALRWITAVGRLMSPGTARRFCWSTAERARGLRAVWERGVHLAAIPPGDADAVGTGADVVVVREGVRPSLGALGAAPHEEACTPPVPVTAWSVLAAVVLQQDEPAARAVLAVLDDVADDAGDDGRLDAAWPMAMAVRKLAVPETDEAEMVLRTASPPGLPTKLRDLVDAPILRAIGGPGAAEAYAHARLVRDTPEADAAAAIYLERAVADRAWLRTDGGAPAPPMSGPRAMAAGRAALAAFATSGTSPWPPNGGGNGADAADLLRMLDLMVAVSALDPEQPVDDPAGVHARHLARHVVLPELIDPMGARRLVAAVGPLGSAVASYVRPVVSEWVGRATRLAEGPVPGDLLAPSVLRWLYPDPLPPPYPTPDGDPDPLLVELAVQVTAVVDDPSALRVLAAAALGRRPGHPADAERLTRLIGSPGWSPGEIVHLLPHLGPVRLAPALVQVLLGEPDGPALRALLDEIDWDPLVAAADAQQAARAFRLRATLATAWWEKAGDGFRQAIQAIVVDGAYLRSLGMAPSVLVEVAAAVIVSAISRSYVVPMQHGLVEVLQGAATDRRGGPLLDLLDRIAQQVTARQRVPIDRLLAIPLVLYDPAAPWASEIPAADATLQAVLEVRLGGVPLPEALLRERHAAGQLPAGLVDAVRADVRDLVRQLRSGPLRQTDGEIAEFVRRRCAGFSTVAEDAGGLLRKLGRGGSAPPEPPTTQIPQNRQEP